MHLGCQLVGLCPTLAVCLHFAHFLVDLDRERPDIQEATQMVGMGTVYRGGRLEAALIDLPDRVRSCALGRRAVPGGGPSEFDRNNLEGITRQREPRVSVKPGL